MLLTLVTLCLLAVDSAQALRVPLEARSIPRDQLPSPLRHRLQPRTNTTAAIKSSSNTQYLANISVGGGEFTIILDTGSSDLWVTGNIPTKQGLGKSATVHYAVGSATGEISTAAVEFASYTVPDQAFIYVQDASSTGLDTSQFSGLLGLGPSSSSIIRNELSQSSSDPFLDRVFRQNISTSNFISFLLPRAGDNPADTVQGEFTIGEVVSGFENVTSQPKVPVNVLVSPLKSAQHWSGTLDGIIGPDGKNIELDSLVPNTDKGKLVAIFDSGFTLPQVPRDVSDAIYGRVQGAVYDTSNGFWTLPCDQEVNVTVTIGGQNYPIHPLDTSTSDLDYNNPDGKTMCVGTFQPITTALDGTFDAVMGMAFLRNTYTYINFGDFIDGNPSNQGDPYIQLLSLTSPSKAHADFVQTRLNNVDSTGDKSHTLLPPSQAQHSPESTGEKAKNAFFRYWPWIVASVSLVIVVGVVWLVFSCCCRRRGRPVKGRFVSGPYRPLNASTQAPAPAMDLHTMHPKGAGGYDNYYSGQY